MNDIETICNCIIDKSLIQKNEIITSAKKLAEEMVEKQNIELSNQKQNFDNNLLLNVNDILSKANDKANLETNKLVLSLKQQILSEIFESVTNMLCNLEIEDYKKLIEKLLIEYANENDGVALSVDTKVDEEFVTSLDVFKERNLKFMYHKSDIRGGFVLFNATSDTVISFEELALEYKENYTNDILDKLFA